MFSSRDGGALRRPRAPTGDSRVRLSSLSLLSGLSVATNGSGGSSNTVTQNSYNKSRQKSRSKQKRHKKQFSSEVVAEPLKMDVFEYLDIGDTRRSSRSDLASPDEDSPSNVEGLKHQNARSNVPTSDTSEEPESEPEKFYRSLSDSGISMGSASSLVPFVPDSPAAKRLSIVQEETLSPASHGSNLPLTQTPWLWSMYCPSPPPVVPVSIAPVTIPEGQQCSHRRCPPSEPLELNPSTATTSKPDDVSSQPQCFRLFTKLSNRHILEMQDELADMEDELELLDSELELVDRDRTLLPDRASFLSARRLQLLQESAVKLESYYRRLKLIDELKVASEPASMEKTSLYTRWLSRTLQPSYRASRLIGSDLHNLSLRGSTTRSRAGNPTYLTITNFLIPLLLYKLIRGILNRLIVLALAIVIGNMVKEKYRMPHGAHDRLLVILFASVSTAAVFL